MLTFRAMNTDVAVAAPRLSPADEQAVARRVAAVFTASERRYSRFRPDSELSRVNRATGPVTVSAEMLGVLRRARQYTILTGGVFDPGVGAALLALGYDRSFSPGSLDREETGHPPRPLSILDVVLDETTGTVCRPPDLQIDLGGFVKDCTVDLAGSLGPVPGVIDAGGDALARGGGPDGAGWVVDVEDPFDPARVVLALRVRDRAVATSAPNRRRWRVGTGQAHHLIDPRARRSADSDLAQVTVVATSTELADVLAKTAFILGSRAARCFLARMPWVGAVLVKQTGGVELLGDVAVCDA
jgi:thiamine biosynthesis lipoprotein